uniref:drug sensory protein A n=1 Tax=Anunuuluaehu liula TaxID=3049639 RepID=UPI003001DC17
MNYTMVMIICTKSIAIIFRFWSGINFKTRFMALATLTVSLVMSSLTFWALNTIQEDSIIADTRFCKDLSILFANNVLDFVEANNRQELASFVEKIYLSTSSIRYILFFQADGSLFFNLPAYGEEVQSLLQLHRNLFHFETQNALLNIPLVKYNTILQNNIIDIIIPLTKNNQALGFLDLGINSNPTLSSSSKLIRDISITIFVSIWLMVIIGATFNSLIITEPIQELLLGVKSIAAGNFSQRIKLTFNNDLGNLILNFNEMAERLESYEKKNVDKLMIEKVKLETIVSTITDGVILVDTELRLLFVNQIAMKAFNWTNLNFIGKYLFNYFPLHINDALLPILNNIVKSNFLYNFNYKTEELCIDLEYNLSSRKFFRFLLTAILDQDNDLLIGVAIIIQDITREVKLNEAKNQFIANISHELRTPLCNIGSFLETLLDYHSCLSSQQQRRFLNIANNETNRLSELVNDILDLSRLESEYNYSLNRVNIAEIIYDIVESSQLIADFNEIKLMIELDPNVKFVWANESSLLQVFANLISNAIKFTNRQGQIVLRVYLIASYINEDNNIKDYENKKQSLELVLIEIIDEGIGIDKRDQKHVFDRFVRIENNIHTLEGTGLGLSIVSNILNKYNTQIILRSDLFVGTSFSFHLLRADL